MGVIFAQDEAPSDGKPIPARYRRALGDRTIRRMVRPV